MEQKIIFLGGGHSNAIALNLWNKNPLPNVDLTLISNVKYTPYSGMLPGYVAGFYSYDDIYIDLPRLAKVNRCNFCLDEAIGLDLKKNQIICQKNGKINFDYLSIDIGSTPDTIDLLEGKDYIIPAKPIPQFINSWHQIINKVQENPAQKISIAIVGGGAAGVELALNIKTRLKSLIDSEQLLNINLFNRSSKILSSHNNCTSNYAYQKLVNNNIKIYLNETANKVIKISENTYQIQCQSDLEINTNYIIWVTQASCPEWIKKSELKTDEKGFILISNTLQSLSHKNVFATGDIATIEGYSRPKSGVFAVKQGKPLLKNLKRIIQNKPLTKYYPQKNYLTLIGTGDKNAIASWGFLGFESPLIWQWKDKIDRDFINTFKYMFTSVRYKNDR